MSATPQLNQAVQSLSQLFAGTDNVSLRVPEYQRAFAWRKQHFGEFWEDIAQFAADPEWSGGTYFLGIIVLVEDQQPGTNAIQEVLDGQQRLTTVTLLLSAVSEFLASEGEQRFSEELFRRYIARTSRSGDVLGYRLILNDEDQAYFRELINGSEPPVASTASQRNLRDCKRLFQSRLNDWRRDADVDHVTSSKCLADALLDQVFVAKIVAFNMKEAGSVFERLNDRGVGLEPVELVRSLVMQRMRDSDKAVILGQWGGIYQQQPPANVGDLLRFHWVTRYGDATTGGLYKLIKSRFNRREEGYDPVSFSRDLSRAASIYRGIYEAVEEDDDYENVSAAAVELNAKPMIPLLMKCHSFDLDRRSRIATAMLNAFMRNRVIANASSTSFEDIVYQLARDTKDDDDSIAHACDQLGQYTLDDSRFKAAFLDRQLTVQKVAKFVLVSLENHLISKHAKGNRILVVGTSRQVHLEHIFPKKPASPGDWALSEQHLSRLGNLTLLGQKENQGLGNRDFAAKSEGYAKSQFKITQQLQEYDEWGPDQIRHRQAWMAEIACEVWPQFTRL